MIPLPVLHIPRAEDRQLAEHAAHGTIKLRVAASYPVEDVAKAYQLMDAGGLRGRAILTF